MIEKIERLKNKGLSLNEIENLLLDGKLGKIRVEYNGYQWIGTYHLSWLVVEIYIPGFVEWMQSHPREYIVHHKDGNRLNNIYVNLQVMRWAVHSELHRSDPKFAETEKVRNEKLSKVKIEWYDNSENDETIKTMIEKMSKTKRKNWIDLSTFIEPFTTEEYSKTSNISFDTAGYRLSKLFKEGQIIRDLKLIDNRWRNVYRRIE